MVSTKMAMNYRRNRHRHSDIDPGFVSNHPPDLACELSLSSKALSDYRRGQGVVRAARDGCPAATLCGHERMGRNGCGSWPDLSEPVDSRTKPMHPLCSELRRGWCAGFVGHKI